MSYRGELERLAREARVGDRDLDAVLHEAYLLGIQAHGDANKAMPPEVYRLATKDGELIQKPAYYSQVKRFYETPGNARRALQFAPTGAKVQAGRVEWTDI